MEKSRELAKFKINLMRIECVRMEKVTADEGRYVITTYNL
jgi:hypothetical protein